LRAASVSRGTAGVVNTVTVGLQTELPAGVLHVGCVLPPLLHVGCVLPPLLLDSCAMYSGLARARFETRMLHLP